MQSRSSPIDKPAAVVIGLDSITGLQTARVLAGHGIPVLGVVRNPHHPGCRTNAWTTEFVRASDTASAMSLWAWRLAPCRAANATTPRRMTCTFGATAGA